MKQLQYKITMDFDGEEIYVYMYIGLSHEYGASSNGFGRDLSQYVCSIIRKEIPKYLFAYTGKPWRRPS